MESPAPAFHRGIRRSLLSALSPAFFVPRSGTHHRGIRCRIASFYALSLAFFVPLRGTHHRGIRRIFLESHVPLRASTQGHGFPGMRGSKLTRKKLLSPILSRKRDKSLNYFCGTTQFGYSITHSSCTIMHSCR